MESVSSILRNILIQFGVKPFSKLCLLSGLLALLSLLFPLSITNANEIKGQAIFHSATINGSVRVKTWKAIRDADLVKQNLDYSCGAASVATILQSFYGLQVHEVDVISAMENDGAATFQDLAEVVQRYGLKGVGIALDSRQLLKLKVPVIAYLHYRDNEHFTVIKGISNQQIALADPSWGNIQLNINKFMEMWNTREDDHFSGKILALLPDENRDLSLNDQFFTLPLVNTTPMSLLMLRRF